MDDGAFFICYELDQSVDVIILQKTINQHLHAELIFAEQACSRADHSKLKFILDRLPRCCALTRELQTRL